MKTTAKIISTLLAMMLLFTAIPFTVGASEAIKTQAEAVEWLNVQEGATYDFNGMNGTQCVEFVKAYVNFLVTGNPWTDCWGSHPLPNGNQMWSSSIWADLGWSVYYNNADFLPQPGDIFSAGISNANHTGVVISSDINTAVIADANARNSEWSDGDPVLIHTKTWSSANSDSPYGATYFIRPNFKTTVHEHSFNTWSFYESVHPHYNCYSCSCGEVQRNYSETNFLDTCEECLNGATPEKPIVTSLKSSYTVGETVALSWQKTANTTHYNISILTYDGEKYDAYRTDTERTEETYSIQLPAGTYAAYVTAYNSNHLNAEGSDYLKNSSSLVNIVVTDVEEIPEPQIITITYDANGGEGAPEPQTYDASSDGWLESELDSYMYEDTKTQYSYRIKQTTSSSEDTLEGWTYTGKKIVAWSDWSEWSTTAITATENIQVETNEVAPTYKTVWQYSRDTGNGLSTYALGYYGNVETITLDYPLTALDTVDGYTRYGSYGTYLANYWWNESVQTVQATAGYTQYRSRTAIYEYTFEKWSDWSNYSDAIVTPSDIIEVQERTMYKYPIGILVSDVVPTRSGYTFIGWTYVKDNADTKVNINSFYSSDSDSVLYALWQSDCQHINTEIINAIAPTCTNVGYSGNTVCTDCGQTVASGNELPVIDHIYKSTIIEATPETQGYTLHTCNMCGHQYSDNYVDYVDENAPKIFLNTKRTVAGKTVVLDLSLSNNPGIVSATLRVNFDTSVLTLVSVEDTKLLGSNSHKPELTSPYTLAWVNDTLREDITANGTIARLTFEIAEDAPEGTYPIEISYNYNNSDIYNYNLESVKFNTINGAVEVIDAIMGDVNGDGEVNNIDRAVLTRYLADWEDFPESLINIVAADVNCDGIVNNMDRAILTRHLADWEGYEALPYTPAQ